MKQPTSSSLRGFTLVEMMIVVVIVGILASIAYPSYTDYIRKGRRAAGQAALVELMQQQERYMTQNNCYLAFTTSGGTATASAPTPAGACGGITPSSVPFKAYAGESANDAVYWLSASACTGSSIAQCVQLTATPTHSDPEAGSLTLSSTGAKSCTGTAASSNPKVCWP